MISTLNNPMFRPPSEADSLILQVVEGCPHNTCAFCGMYKNVQWSPRSDNIIKAMIDEESKFNKETNRIFLADGDVMNLPFEKLMLILRYLQQQFPYLNRVNTYANGSSILAKSDVELKKLHENKLQTLYMGLESGDERTLAEMNKRETASEMITAGQRAQAAGLKMSVMILLGLGGKTRTKEHAMATADALNKIQPRLLSALRVVPVPGTLLYRKVTDRSFELQTEYEIVKELKMIIENLELTGTVFRANHSSNIIPLKARLPHDKNQLLYTLEDLLESGMLDKESPGAMPLTL